MYAQTQTCGVIYSIYLKYVHISDDILLQRLTMFVYTVTMETNKEALSRQSIIWFVDLSPW
jgi:hypothetical protein